MNAATASGGFYLVDLLTGAGLSINLVFVTLRLIISRQSPVGDWCMHTICDTSDGYCKEGMVKG
jgi:hypothetical protein